MKLEKYKQRNPKKIGIAVFTITCVLLIAFVFIYSSFASFQTNETRTFINGNVVDPGDLYFAFYVDGVISSTMPAKGKGYTFDKEKSVCTNGATVEWLDDEWAPKINNLTQTRTKCTLYFKINAVGYIMNSALQEENQDYWYYDDTVDNNLRSVDGDKYILLDNQLWMIIGTFNNVDDGTGNKETRIKIINLIDPVTSFEPEVYYNGFSENTKKIISDASWPVGIIDSNKLLTGNIAQQLYSLERQDFWVSKIGLMSMSDVYYSTPNNVCYNLRLDESFQDCYLSMWLWYYGYSGGTSTVVLTRDASNNFLALSDGLYPYFIYFDSADMYFPSAYLDANTIIESGTGTWEDPFIPFL